VPVFNPFDAGASARARLGNFVQLATRIGSKAFLMLPPTVVEQCCTPVDVRALDERVQIISYQTHRIFENGVFRCFIFYCLCLFSESHSLCLYLHTPEDRNDDIDLSRFEKTVNQFPIKVRTPMLVLPSEMWRQHRQAVDQQAAFDPCRRNPFSERITRAHCSAAFGSETHVGTLTELLRQQRVAGLKFDDTHRLRPIVLRFGAQSCKVASPLVEAKRFHYRLIARDEIGRCVCWRF